MGDPIWQAFDRGNEIGSKLAEAMQRKRTDAIANELLSRQTGQTHTGGAAELKMHLQLEQALASQELRKARVEAPKYFHDGSGGVTTVNPTTGAKSYERPAGAPPVKPSVDPVEMKKFEAELSAHHRRKAELEKEISTVAASPGSADEHHAQKAELEELDGKIATMKTEIAGGNKYPGLDAAGGPWFFGQDNSFESEIGRLSKKREALATTAPDAKLDTLRKELEALKTPEPGAGVYLSPKKTAAAAPSEEAQALQWAQSNPRDPRAAKILQALGK